MSHCEYVEIVERCTARAEYRCTPWTCTGDLLESSHRLSCGDAEHLLQTVAEMLENGAASVDVAEWMEPSDVR